MPMEHYRLNNGVSIPTLGFGTFKISDQDVQPAVELALAIGYRHIDTAVYYQNEEGVGRAIKASGLSRQEVFITSKLWTDDFTYEKASQSIEQSLERLQVDYLDLYLLHWPKPNGNEAWQALEEAYRQKKVRAIGVSNYTSQYLDDLLRTATIKPVLNQVERHPHLQQKELNAYCQSQSVAIEAWSPLKRGKIVDDPVLQKIAQNHEKTVAQVALRWQLQSGMIVIPKSTHRLRIEENYQVFDFSLSEEEMVMINGLDKNERVGSNPEDVYQR